MTSKKKSTKQIEVHLPCGGSLKFPHNTSDDTIREKCAVVDPACAGASLTRNDDGSRAFVRTMGTKG